ncbi:MAG: class I SAM-dependent methyltransferase [Deltaproteobacteria bacterium]|nr:class I SAM-dependent methyltransferase [Deltaproteobacteria bacterium]
MPFVPTPPEVVDRMLQLAQVTEDDVIYDLGSGDGRILITAAKRYGARGVGVEIDSDLVERSRSQARKSGVSQLIEFREQDAFTVDVSPATVVTLYMLPEFNAKLRPLLEKQLKPGSRVVSHDFPVEGWIPSRADKMPGDFFHDHTVYLFIIGEGRQR